MQHVINWFEIPTAQLGRATDFYRALTGLDLKVENFGNGEIVVFKGDEKAVRGALVRNDHHTPGLSGALVYLNTANFDGGLDGALARVPAAGGTVILPRTNIGPNGFIGRFKDSEGNLVGLHEA